MYLDLLRQMYVAISIPVGGPNPSNPFGSLISKASSIHATKLVSVSASHLTELFTQARLEPDLHLQSAMEESLGHLPSLSRNHKHVFYIKVFFSVLLSVFYSMS